MRPLFLTDIHRMRGIAILLIVATHCMYSFAWERHSLALALLSDLFDNSTIVFVFISGYLFRHGAPSFKYREYLTSKIRNVLVPFVLVSIPAIAEKLWERLFSGHGPSTTLAAVPGEVLQMLVYPALHLDYALWFIPVIAIYYLAAPLFIKLSTRPAGYAVLCVLIPLSTLMQRPTYAEGHNFVLALYFLSAYVLGMWCCEYRQRLTALIDSHLTAFIAAFVLMVAGHLLLSTHHGKYVVVDLANSGSSIDWLYLQKLLLLPVLMGLTWRFRKLRMPWLDFLADVSFTVFFLHLYVLYFVDAVSHWALNEVSLLGFMALLACAVLVPCAVAWTSRRVFRQHSRLLLGS